MRTATCVFVLAGMLAAAVAPAASATQGPELATFSCDITVPVGHPLEGGWVRAAEKVAAPLLARGVILRDGAGTYVLAALDWCELRNDAWALFRDRIAAAAGTTPDRVAVQCTHTHSGPLTDRRAQELLAEVQGPAHADLAFLDKAAADVAGAVESARAAFRPVTAVGLGRARVDRVASNRRVLRPDGTVAVRYSTTRDPALRAEPEGLIDPDVRTVAFFDGPDMLACLHYYATHPQTRYGDGLVTPDTCGLARERLERETGVFQVYFTGCAGNVTVGKYNDGEPGRREELTGRLYEGMKASLASVERVPAGPISWRTRAVRFPPRSDGPYTPEQARKTLADSAAPANDRIHAAMILSTWERFLADRPAELSCLAMGPLRILNLPGEAFVEFQLLASELAPGRFVAAAAYGDCFSGYICTEKAFVEGGYEPTQSHSSPATEGYMKAALADLLSEAPPPPRPVLRSVARIWDAGGHNAFTDLLRYGDWWYCVLREGEAHVSEKAGIRVIRSRDGTRWESAALLSRPGADYRDAKLSVGPDGRLVLAGCSRTWPPKYPKTLQSWVSFSADGSTWAEPVDVIDRDWWLWRITWQDGIGWGVGYDCRNEVAGAGSTSRLLRTRDAIHFEPVTTFSAEPRLTEATLRFGPDGRMYCLHRRDTPTHRTALLGRAESPYEKWTWQDSGFYFGGPDAILHEGVWYAGGRWLVGSARTVLARVNWELGTLEPCLALPSGGDTSYPGFESVDGELWMTYYSSHEDKTAVYLARIGFER